MTSLPYCKYCNQQVKPGESYLRALGGSYHNNCFKCRKCGSFLGTNQFYNINNDAFCGKCHAIHDVPNCNACNRPLERGTDFLRYEGQTFHTKCFLCNNCRTELSDRDFFKHEGGRYCSNCIDRVSVNTNTNTNTNTNQNYNTNTNTNTNYNNYQQQDNYNNNNNNYNNNNYNNNNYNNNSNFIEQEEERPSKPLNDEDESPVIEYQATIIEPEDNFEVESFGFDVKDSDEAAIDIDINEMINEVDALGTEINAEKRREREEEEENDSDDIDSLEDALNSLSTFAS